MKSVNGVAGLLMRKKISGLYLILDRQFITGDIISAAIEAVEGGVDVIQYREKGLPKRETIAIARQLRHITRERDIPFIINDDPVVALAVDADGVHLGQEDIPIDIARNILGEERMIGLSTHNLKEALEAEKAGVDYIGFGPIFHSRTKMVAPPLGLEGIKRVRGLVSIPIIAIGGIDSTMVEGVISSGASGVAVISAILSSPSIKKAVHEFKERSQRVGPR